MLRPMTLMCRTDLSITLSMVHYSTKAGNAAPATASNDMAISAPTIAAPFVFWGFAEPVLVAEPG